MHGLNTMAALNAKAVEGTKIIRDGNVVGGLRLEQSEPPEMASTILVELVKWERRMGGFESSVWRDAERYVDML